MNRVIGHLAVLVVLGLSAFDAARASDIDCKSALGAGSVRCEDPQGNGMRCALATGARPRNKHLVCASAELSMRYERLYAEQQKLLRSGVTNEADVGAWRARRDACGSERCLDSLFHEWWRWRDAARMRPAKPTQHSAQASTSVAAPNPPRQEPTPPVEVQAPPAQPLAMQQDPQPTVPAAPAAASLQTEPIAPTSPNAPNAPTPPATITTEQAPPAPPAGAMVLPGLLAGAAAVGAGAAFLWKRQRARRAPPGYGRRRGIPAGMAIFYGLIIVNVLLLAFTLGSG